MGLSGTTKSPDLPRRFRRERCLRNAGTREKRRNAVATLSVLKFNDPSGADRVLLALQGMQERQLITLKDAAVVSWPEERKKPQTRQLSSTTGAGAAFGAFWGLLFGVIFFLPLLGMAVGAAIGTLTGSLANVGIDEAFINNVREKVTPGTSALFALTSEATEDRVIEELKQFDFEIISTNLPEEQERKLREAFGEEPYVPAEQREPGTTRVKTMTQDSGGGYSPLLLTSWK